MVLLFRCVTSVSIIFLATTPLVGRAQRVTDSEVTGALQQAFQRNSRLRQANIKISTSNGSVTLKGTVASFQESYQANQIARRTVGVRTVRNLIQIDSSIRGDEETADDIRRRLSQSSFLRGPALSVNVSHGIVTLVGEVPTWAESQQAERVAREVLGVKLVRNNLTLRDPRNLATSAWTAEEIRARVEAELRRDTYLAELPIRVSVEAGTVCLDGEVANLYQRERAAEQARRVAGGPAIVNRLVVISQLISEILPEPPSDEELEKLVLNELDADPRVAAGDVDVNSSRGQLVLRGSVASMYEKVTVARVARSVVGVVRVENLLEVAAEQRSGNEIRDDVQSNLSSDSLLAGQKIAVTVQDATVTLSGELEDYTSKHHAARLTARVRGVGAITNDLKVRWSESTNDDSVRQSIVGRLTSNAITHPVAGHIQVVVKDGRVVLAGEVVQSSELMEAERIAGLTDGVRSVENRLALVARGK